MSREEGEETSFLEEVGFRGPILGRKRGRGVMVEYLPTSPIPLMKSGNLKSHGVGAGLGRLGRC